MNIGIVGLGLIGGSFARAYALEGHSVFAWDKDKDTLAFARLTGAVHGELDQDNIGSCQLLLICIYIDDALKWLTENAAFISGDTVVMDSCGVKSNICRRGFALAKEHGFTFVGGHPMAGTQFSGFKYSKGDLFQGETMVLCPPCFDDIKLLDKCKQLLAPCGFAHFSVTAAADHDKMIAFTSQMPHLLSNAFIKSPTALGHKGFSAGSYRDLTRVAWLNPQMWADLFTENKDCLLAELNTYINSLEQYRQALIAEDKDALILLLQEGKRRKEEVDG